MTHSTYEKERESFLCCVMHIVHSAAQCLSSCGGACIGHSIRDQSRDFHTANYSKLINQHNLISCTHMESACWCVAVCLQRVGTAAVWICLRGRDELLSHHHTQTHTLPSSPEFASHQRNVFREIFCVLTGLHKAQADLQELPHTQTLCSHRSISGFELQSLLGWGGGGCQAG